MCFKLQIILFHYLGKKKFGLNFSLFGKKSSDYIFFTFWKEKVWIKFFTLSWKKKVRIIYFSLSWDRDRGGHTFHTPLRLQRSFTACLMVTLKTPVTSLISL